jgi:hypothetical protein
LPASIQYLGFPCAVRLVPRGIYGAAAEAAAGPGAAAGQRVGVGCGGAAPPVSTGRRRVPGDLPHAAASGGAAVAGRGGAQPRRAPLGVLDRHVRVPLLLPGGGGRTGRRERDRGAAAVVAAVGRCAAAQQQGPQERRGVVHRQLRHAAGKVRGGHRARGEGARRGGQRRRLVGAVERERGAPRRLLVMIPSSTSRSARW